MKATPSFIHHSAVRIPHFVSGVERREPVNLRARDDPKVVLVVEGEARRRAADFNQANVATRRVEHLHALEVADVDAPLVIDGYRVGRAELSGLVAVAAELRQKFSVGRELEDGVVERAERVDLARAVAGDARVEFRLVGLSADGRAYDSRDAARRVEARDVVARVPGEGDESAVRRRRNVVVAAGREDAERLAGRPFVTRDLVALHDEDRPAAVCGHPAQRHLPVNRPLVQELAGRVEDLYAPTRILADVDVAVCVQGDATRVREVAGADAFAPERQFGLRVAVARALLRRREAVLRVRRAQPARAVGVRLAYLVEREERDRARAYHRDEGDDDARLHGVLISRALDDYARLRLGRGALPLRQHNCALAEGAAHGLVLDARVVIQRRAARRAVQCVNHLVSVPLDVILAHSGAAQNI